MQNPQSRKRGVWTHHELPITITFMKAHPASLFAALLLAPILAPAGAVIREEGAVYLEDFMKQPVRLTTLADTSIFYQSDLGRYLGTIRKGQIVELQAVGEKAWRIRGKAQQGQVAGWVPATALSPLRQDFLDNLRQNALRKTEVDALIQKNEVAVNMTPDEVSKALGKVSKKTSRLDANGREEIWEFIRYKTVPQEIQGYDRDGRLYTRINYVKVPNGKLAVTFQNNLVSALEQSEGTFDRDARVKIVASPINVAF